MISNITLSVTIGYPEHLLQPLHLYNFGIFCVARKETYIVKCCIFKRVIQSTFHFEIFSIENSF